MSRSRPVLPYRVLRSDSVVPSPLGWALVVGQEALDHLLDGSPLSAWDALLEFRLESEFTFRLDPYRALDLEDTDAVLELVVSIATGGGVAREIHLRSDVAREEVQSHRAVISPSSEHLARDLTITSGIYLKDSITRPRPLVPCEAGARLWETTERIRLEGGAARLPIYSVPFPQVFAGDGIDQAEFHVEVAEEIDLELESCLTVYVNTERSDFVAQLAQKGSPAERRLWNGVVRRVLLQSMLSGALDDLETDGVGNSGSLAATARRWAAFVWPNEPVERLRELAQGRYALCEAQIDGWLASLDDSRRMGRGA